MKYTLTHFVSNSVLHGRWRIVRRQGRLRPIVEKLLKEFKEEKGINNEKKEKNILVKNLNPKYAKT